MINTRNFKSIWKISFIPLIFLVINSGYYFRNIKLTGNITGKSKEKYFNESISPNKALLNVAKNAGLHFGVFPLSSPANKLVYKLHNLLDEQIDNPDNNWPGTMFSLRKWHHHEDNGSNVFQVLLVIFLLVITIFKRTPKQKLRLLLLLFPVLEFITFSFFLKWQPWNSRLHTPMFFIFSLPVAYYFGERKELKRVFFNSLVFIMIMYSILIILLNPSRPLFTLSIKNGIANNRFAKYFTNQPDIKDEYQQIKEFLNNNKGRVGIITGGDTWEYPFYYNIYSENTSVAPHLNVSNFSKNATWNDKTDKSKIQYIVSTTHTQTINFNNSIFHKIISRKNFSIYELHTETH